MMIPAHGKHLWPSWRRSGSGECPALVLALGLLALSTHLAAPLSAQTVEGRLLDATTGEPIAAGIITLLNEDSEVLDRAESDSTGHFRIEAPRVGSYFLRGQQIGYRTVTDGIFELGRGGRLEVEIHLRIAPVELEGIEATVERTDFYEKRRQRLLEGQGFYDRQRRTSGYFITPEDIEARPPNRPNDLFRRIPGVTTGSTTGTPGSDGIVSMRCAGSRLPPTSSNISSIDDQLGGFAVYIDGNNVFQGRVWDSSMDISMADITAVEVYPRIATVPIEYASLGVCGVILIWTR